MQHPKSSAVRTVIENLKRALPFTSIRNHLSMTCTKVSNSAHSCGTIHCHASWYVIGKGIHLDREDLTFIDGIKEMEIDLELRGGKRSILFFSSPTMKWANDNPEIWGNRKGSSLFSSRMAFVSPNRPRGANSLSDIIDHWEEVYKRLVMLENQTDISDPPITAEELIS